jgi:glucose-6-phosphate 1-dehydrogenase
MSLSFYGKRPGPGMRLDKLSMQFAMHDTGMISEVLEAYERLILDAMRGDHTLFTTAEGIERLWEVSMPLLEAPPPVRLYPPGDWGPKSIHQLVAPHAWRLPFERVWRNPNAAGGRFLEVVLLPEIRSSSRLVHLWVQVAVEQSDLAIVFTMNVYRFLL